MNEASAARVPRRAGIKEVAARAGVSLKTVTNVVHRRSNVSDSTRRRVLQAIADLDYQPSLLGRRLQSGKSDMITLAVPRIDEPYLGALAHAVNEAAATRGYTVVLDETAGRVDREQRAAEGYPGHGIDGVIFSPLVIDPERMADRSRRTAIVMLGEPVPGGNADYVAIDNRQSAWDITDHLVATGRSRIGFLGATPERPTGVGAIRYAGVAERLRHHGLNSLCCLELSTYSRETGFMMVRAAASEMKQLDALVCASDLLALGALTALRDLGIAVPRDMAVTGWDNIVDGQYHVPTLTTVAPDLQTLAETALDALLARIGGEAGPGRDIVVGHQVIVRESSGAAPPSQ